VNPDRPADPRQQALTDALRCYYDDARHRPLRPHCQGVAVVAYGLTRPCASCDAMRSSVGKGTAPRPLPAVELAHLIDAAKTAADAHDQLADAARAARHAGATWAQIGDALGLTRQAAQQRWSHCRFTSASGSKPPTQRPNASATRSSIR
jgi:hypothetical protein